MNRIYIGYDPREHDAYLVARNSIEKRASEPVLIQPLIAEQFGFAPPIKRDGQMWDLESDAPQSTLFARSRFIIPKIQKEGWALFIDCDFLCLADIKELFDLADPKYAVMVVKHDYEVKESVKMDGQVQTAYPKKNWSSAVLWNCESKAHMRLTDPRLHWWPGRRLHAFEWLQDDEIGSLPRAWNHLVDVYPHDDNAKMLHYTLGTPNLPDYEDCGYSQLWWNEHGHKARALPR
jgi:lipopolysaccharide biosynthesis glycosyltransferase